MKTWEKHIFFYITLVSVVMCVGYIEKYKTVQKAHAQEIKIISPIPTETPTPTPPLTEREQIVAYVKEVFGPDAPRAFKILECENRSMNPRALNDNTLWGGRGIDKGLWQINTSWQGVTNDKFLFDWRINTLMAKKIFDDWGGNFRAWTCGR